MTLRVVNQRSTAVLCIAGTLLAASLAAAPQADAAALYACVKKNGTARIFKKKPKCRKGETKLSWNVGGPAGKGGANGANGKEGTAGKEGKEGNAGANGAVAGYAATQSGVVNITSGQELVVSKTLPAGHYLVSAKVETSAVAKGAGLAETECNLFDGGTLLDSSQWSGTLSELVAGTFLGGSALPLQAVLNTNATSTLSLTCETLRNRANEDVLTASEGQLFAVQTSSNS